MNPHDSTDADADAAELPASVLALIEQVPLHCHKYVRIIALAAYRAGAHAEDDATNISKAESDAG